METFENSKEHNDYVTSQNPLYKYRSYSYHHILLATSDIDIAEDFAKSDNTQYLYDHPDNTPNADPNNSKRFQVKTTPSGKKYIVIINGMTDTQFYIDRFELDNIISPDANTAKNHKISALAAVTMGKMTVVEPLGARFYEIVSTCSHLLRKQGKNTFFLLKTVFVGYADDGELPSAINDIPPVTFAITDISAVFSHTGGTYEIALVSLDNGIAHSPTIQQPSNWFSVQTSNKLKDVVSALNESLKKHQTEDTKNQPRDTINYVAGYEIKLDPAYDSYLVDNVNSSHMDTPGIIQLSAQNGESISISLERLLGMSTQISNETRGLGKDGKNTGKYFKPTITNKTETDSQGKIKFVWYIDRTEIPMMPPNDELCTKNKITFAEGRKKKIEELMKKAIHDRAYLEFNYVFTGKNLDILEFDMKLAYTGLTTIYNTNVYSSPSDAVQSVSSGGSVSKVNNSGSPCGSSYIPLSQAFGGNAPDMNSHAIFQNFLSQQVQIETAMSKIKIVGNPLLLGGMSTTSGENSSNFLMSKWRTSPNIAKINVMMPAINERTGMPDLGNSPGPQKAYTESFWYDGLFYIVNVKSVFEKGTFTQELQLIQLPTETSIANSTKLDSTASNDAKVGGGTGSGKNRSVDQAKEAIRASSSPKLTNSDKIAIQVNALKLAGQIANSHSSNKYSPTPETLQSIILVESNAGLHKMNNQVGNTATGLSQINVPTLQNILKISPSGTNLAMKYFGTTDVSTIPPEDLLNKSYKDDKFNLEAAVVLFQDNAQYIESYLKKDGVTITPQELQYRAIVAHNIGFTPKTKTNVATTPIQTLLRENKYLRDTNFARHGAVQLFASNGQNLTFVV